MFVTYLGISVAPVLHSYAQHLTARADTALGTPASPEGTWIRLARGMLSEVKSAE